MTELTIYRTASRNKTTLFFYREEGRDQPPVHAVRKLEDCTPSSIQRVLDFCDSHTPKIEITLSGIVLRYEDDQKEYAYYDLDNLQDRRSRKVEHLS